MLKSPVVSPDATRPASGEIVLISCYELGHQPMGVASPAGFLREAGLEAAMYDVAVDRFDPAWVAQARFVGISVPMHTALRMGIRVAQRIREVNPDCHICLYGLYASLNAPYLLDHGVDSCIGGESEAALVELVQAVLAGEPLQIPGVSVRGALAAPRLERLDFPRPERRGLAPFSRYAKLVHDETQMEAGYVEASRGCKHTCTHCPITPVYNGRFFVVAREAVLEDVAQQVAAGARHITFGDPDFLNGPRHASAVARDLHDAFPDVTFDFTAKISHLLQHRDLLPEFARLGCLFIVSAAESFSDDVLRILQKGHTRADVLAAVAATREAGIALRPSFVPFTPWTTLEAYAEMLRLIAQEQLVDAVDPVQYAVRLLLPPGSPLVDDPEVVPHRGARDAALFSYRWTHPDPRMDALHADVSAAVETAARCGEDPADTFGTVWGLAHGALNGAARIESPPEVDRNRCRVPRLTESWFC